YGIYHATNEGICSWADFAEEIFRQSDRQVTIHRVTTEEYGAKAPRPKNSRMSKDKLVEAGFYKLPDWKDALSRYLKEIQE
ncbi:MAG: sugar nucleotide-binding protein, partial [Lachnospiraceae bacterium]